MFFPGLVGANIPLHKLRLPAIKEMFKKRNIIIPTESFMRRKINYMGNTMKILIGKKIEGKDFFIIF